jgi:CheY-like chemotaxis protein
MNVQRPVRPADKAQPRLLIVDDESAIVVPLARYFRSSGYTVVTASEAAEAEAILTYESFDLVILDLSLSQFGPDGLEVLRSIRARSLDLPVIVLSANIRPELEAQARLLAASAILAKPQPLDELARVATQLMGDR